MPSNRRDFIKLVAAGAAASAATLSSLGPAEASAPTLKALAFDAFPIFDPSPIAGIAEAIFPGKAPQFIAAWRIRQFEYTWLRCVGQRYADFWKVTSDSMVAAAKATQLDLKPADRDRLLNSFLELKAYPDVAPALKALKAKNVKLGFLSNFTRKMLDAGIKNSGLEGVFDQVLSTDTIRSYKPDPRAYRMAIDAFKLKKEEIGFVAFAGWDAAGASWFGYRTFWANRAKQAHEELDFAPDGTVTTMTELVPQVLGT